MKENKEIICPTPRLWNAIYEIAKEEYIKKYHVWDKDDEFHCCVPLILNGWVFTNDFEKEARWKQLVDWIKMYELDFVLDKIESIAEKLNIDTDEMWYYSN